MSSLESSDGLKPSERQVRNRNTIRLRQPMCRTTLWSLFIFGLFILTGCGGRPPALPIVSIVGVVRGALDSETVFSQFREPQGITLDANGDIYITEHRMVRAQKFSPNGQLLAKWGDLNELYDPKAIALDVQGNVYILDGNDIKKYTSNGQPLAQWKVPVSWHGEAIDSSGIVGMVLDEQGNIYVVADSGGIQELSPQGQTVAQWSLNFRATAITRGINGNLYVTSEAEGRIFKMSSQGELLDQWTIDNFFPAAIAIDRQNDILAVDARNSHILKLSPDGHLLTQWGSLGSDPGRFNEPSGIALDAHGNVYVTDFGNDRVQKFSPDGQFLMEWTRVIVTTVTPPDAGSGSLLARHDKAPNDISAHMSPGWGGGGNDGNRLCVVDFGYDNVGSCSGEIGTSVDWSFEGFAPDQSISVNVRYLNRIVRSAEIKAGSDGVGTWSLPIRPTDPLGNYTITAKQSLAKQSLAQGTAKFVVRPWSGNPAVKMLGKSVGSPGSVFNIVMVGFRSGQFVRLDLFRAAECPTTTVMQLPCRGNETFGHETSYVTSIRIRMNQQGDALYVLRTRVDDAEGFYDVGTATIARSGIPAAGDDWISRFSWAHFRLR